MQVDQRNWQLAWRDDPRNPLHDMTGSKEAFSNNPQFAPEVYADKLLKKFGMNREGFTNFFAIDNAARNGWISPEMAARAHLKLERQIPKEGYQAPTEMPPMAPPPAPAIAPVQPFNPYSLNPYQPIPPGPNALSPR
jgi:hypothetical protein